MLTAFLTILDRETVKRKIEELLSKHEPVFLTGLFGIGKKRFVKSFAENANDYSVFINDDNFDENKINNKLVIFSTSPNAVVTEKVIRDFRKHKDENSYIFVLQLEELENSDLYNNISGTTIFLPFLNEKDFAQSIAKYSEKFNCEISKIEAEIIYQMSGGHPGIVKRLIQFAGKYRPNTQDQWNESITFQPIKMKLEKLHRELETISTDLLYKSSLIDKGGNVRIPIINLYEKSICQNVLSSKEKDILKYLVKNTGNIVTKIDIHLNSGGDYENFSLWGTYKSIERLKEKVKNKYKIENIKSKGYRLTQH